MKIVLASGSPRRRELLGQIGLSFQVQVSNAEEQTSAAAPRQLVEELSHRKAEAVLRDMGWEEGAALPEDDLAEGDRGGEQRTDSEDGSEAVLVIGADTVVAVDGHILGKPVSLEAAADMLRTLSGRSHEVYTGVTLLYSRSAGQVVRKTFHERTEVVFYPMSEAEIAAYVSTGDCMDKAGAYGIQGFCARYIREIKGDYNNVVGLPIGRLYQEAREWLGER